MKEKSVFLLEKNKKKKKEKNIKSNPPPFPPPSQKPTQHKKIKARPPLCISGFIMGNNQKMPLNSWTCLFFPVLIWINKKKDFTLLFISFGWDYSRILQSSLQSLQRSQMEAIAGRIEQTARPGCTSYSLRSENHQLPSNSDWVEKHTWKK